MNIEKMEQLAGTPTKNEQRILRRRDRVHDAVKSALELLRTEGATPLELSTEKECALRGYVGETLVGIGDEIGNEWGKIQLLPKGRGERKGFGMFSSDNLIDPILDIQEVGQGLPEDISKFAPILTVQAVHRLRLEDTRIPVKK